MALTARSRSVLYRGLTDMLEDEVAVGELLSYFPARDVEEPATKEFVAAQVADVRTEIAELRADLVGQMSELRADLVGQMSELRVELAGQTAGVRADMGSMEARLMAHASAQQRLMIQWTLGAMVSLAGLVMAMGFFRGP